MSDVPPTVPAATAVPAPGTSFGPGSQIVGQDAQPGSYSATANDLCYWERLSGFGGDSGDIIANAIAESGQRVIVEIAATDVGFSSSGCGTWMKLA